LAEIASRSQQVCALSASIEKLTGSKWERRNLGDVIVRVKDEVDVQNDAEYSQITVKLYGKGVVERGRLLGRKIKTRPQFRARAGNLIMSRIDARNGAFGIIPPELDGALVTQDFPMFEIEPSLVIPEYLALLMKSQEFTEICRRSSRGTTNRKRLKEVLLLAEQIPVPPKTVQQQLLTFANEITKIVNGARNAAGAAEEIEQNVCNLTLLI
jgi:restriction endonuclease S subunit